MSSAPSSAESVAGPPAAAPAVPAVPGPPGGSRTSLVLGILVMSAFVMILNETILSVALRDLARDLGVATTTVQWLTSGFLLTMAVVIPTTGYLLVRFRPRQIFAAAMTLFTLGTLLGALAPGFEVLMAARVLQAAGTAVMIPLLMTTVMRLVPVERRGATMGTITIVIAVAPAVGPTIGGAVLSTLDWRWMFWLVLPLAAVALVLGTSLLRLPTDTRRVPLDLLSMLLSAVGFSGVLYGLSTIGESGQSGPVLAWTSIAVGIVALAVFAWRQIRLQRADRALLDLRPFGYRDFTVALTVSALVFMCFLGASAILLPLYLQTVLGASPFVSGLALLPGGLVLGLLGRPVGALYDRVGARRLVIPGAAAIAAALWLFAALGAGSPLALVVGIHMLLMAGLGLMITPLMTDSLGALPSRLYSHGSAILSTLQQVAGAFGTAVFVTIATHGSLDPAGLPDAAGLRLAFAAAGCVGVLSLVGSLFVRGIRAREPSGSPARDAA
ncbi:DHA2 family efflux MFS transporter permease subunit [Streptosporangium sp. NPDC023615]|uniref:DHA2 family efflux MFS transporter permease subunit n=1 Tax=Streptosporangium sp. NPDC023615 TaxID=3154794 RepID=UPI00343FCEE3